MKDHTAKFRRHIAASAAVILLAAGCVRTAAPPVMPEERQGDSTRRVSIVFGGDVMQHMPQVQAARRDSIFDYSGTFRFLKPYFDTADLVVVNFETTVSATGRYSGYPLFSSPAALAEALRDCGVDAVTLANNHIADRGRKGIEATVAALDAAGVRHTGAFADSAAYLTGNPLSLESGGVRLAMLNYTYGLNGMPVPANTVINLIDTTLIARDLDRIDRDSVDHIIIYFHWGAEYAKGPDGGQRELAAWCHARGVDFVIGSHPHVIHPVELHRDPITGRVRTLTAYSLGNLVSNQRERRTDGGLLLRLDIEHRSQEPPVINVSYMLPWVRRDRQGSHTDYLILPPAAADSLLPVGSPARKAWNIFIADSREILRADSTMLETGVPSHNPLAPQPDTSIKPAGFVVLPLFGIIN